MKFYGHRYKILRVRTFYVTVIRVESCFEKNAFEDTENPHPLTKTRLPMKEYLRKYSRYRKQICFVLKLFLRPILFHGKHSFDHLTYFKLYGNLKCWFELNYNCSVTQGKNFIVHSTQSLNFINTCNLSFIHRGYRVWLRV